MSHCCAEQYNDTWAVDGSGTFSEEAWASVGSSRVFEAYSRPVYTYVQGLPEEQTPGEGNGFSLIYSGNRWFKIYLLGAQDEVAAVFWAWTMANYHAFWARAYAPGITTLVSEPTYKDTPVGVDFFYIGEQDNQFGPFGLLIPAQKHNMTGVS